LFGGGDSGDTGGPTAVDESGNESTPVGIEQDEEANDTSGTNDVWDLIPSWEYDGKYVQSGGHSWGEQERALQDIQRQVEDIERSENEGEPRPDQ
jgi:hypothetical protein